MGTGIQICGLNGCGKSTIGRMLADRLGFHFIDNENLYFARSGPNEPYARSRSREEAEHLLLDEVRSHEDFVFAAVRGDYGKAVIPLYDYVVLVEVPKAIRMERVRSRSHQKFGSRMLPGGDLHEPEEAFFRVVAARAEDYAASWLSLVGCPVLRIDGTRPVEESVALIVAWMEGRGKEINHPDLRA